MKNLIVLLSFLLVCVGCTNGYIYCYYCPNCPNPFYANSAQVTQVISHTGFCAKKSYTSDANAPNSRGVAEPGLCVVTGCRWVHDSATGRQMHVCCCNSNYCNGSM